MKRIDASPRRKRLCLMITTALCAAVSIDAHADADAALLGPDATAAPMLQVTAPYALPPAKTAEDPSVPMVLAVSLNQTRQEELLTLQRHGDGSFSVMAGDLRRFRLKIDPAIADDAMVRLDSIPHLRTTYDQAGQELALEVADDELQAYEVSLGGEPERTDMRLLQSLPAMILNYDVTATHQGITNSTYANLEALWSGRYGVLSTTALYDDAGANANLASRAVRLDSTWRYVDPTHVRSWVVGDFTSNTLSWGSSVRLAGFQVASDFSQRADIVTAALPQFSGSAALPSTLDLYVNQQKVYSGEIPSGPYQLKSLPYLSGGDVTVVTTDASGHQTTTTQAFYYDAALLQQGISQYSFDVGLPRFNYATRSSDYDDTVFGSGAWRYGLSRATTVEGATEFSGDGLVNLGGGVVQSLAGRGTLAVSGAASRYKGEHGSLGSVALQGQIGGVRLYGSTQRSFGDYFDLARVSDVRLMRRESGTTSVLDSTALASAIDRAGLSFVPWFDSTSVNLSFNRIRYANGESTRYANLSLSRGLTRRMSVNASAYATLGGSDDDHGFYVTFNVSFGRNLYAAAGAQRSNGRMAYTQQINGSGGTRQDSTSWGLSGTENGGGPDQQNAYVSYLSRIARLSARYYGYGGSQRIEAEASGSLIATAGSAFAANQIGDAYVVVENAGPGAEILQGGVRMGQTNRKGQLLLPNIQPYYQQQIYADPAGLPDGWELARTELTAVAGYRQGAVVDFGASKIDGAVLVLHDANGKPIAPGFNATLANGESAVVGYDGQVYLRGLKASNRVSVDLGSAGTCTADFAYDPNGPIQPVLGPVTCK